jgi:hypothetical protein
MELRKLTHYSDKYIPVETQKLVEIMKKMIITNNYNPFVGPIWDNKGQLRLNNDEAASHEQILKMNWQVDNVEAEEYQNQA